MEMSSKSRPPIYTIRFSLYDSLLIEGGSLYRENEDQGMLLTVVVEYGMINHMDELKSASWWEIPPHIEGYTIGVSRPTGDIVQYRGGVANKNGAFPIYYEKTDRGALSGWIKYICFCGNMFWGNEGVDKAGKCIVCVPRPKTTGPRVLDLVGRKFGSIVVLAHEKGKGWKIRCWCQRERHIINSTALGAGVYKTCGQCTVEERFEGKAEADAAAKREDEKEYKAGEVARAQEPANDPPRNMQMCDEGHEYVYFKRNDDGCPLCVALARIELQEG